MKRIFSIALSLAMVFTLSATAFAAEPITAPTTETTELSTQDRSTEVIASKEFKLVPLTRETFYGDAGTCTLDYLAGGYVTWTITMPGVNMTSFSGNLHFNKLGTPFGTFDHSIYSTEWSGTEDVKSNLSKGDWEVDFTGIATAADGSMYAVVDNASIKFYVNGR